MGHHITVVERENVICTDKGFSKKVARFLKFKNISDLLSDDKEGKII